MHFTSFAVVSSVVIWTCTLMTGMYPQVMLGAAVTCSIVGNVVFLRRKQFEASDVQKVIKINAEVTLGLIPVLVVAVTYNTNPSWFTYYVNVAVLGNIAMMVFVDSANTYRGISSRFACLALVAWLWDEMTRVGWQTVEFDAGFFIFNASPPGWILAHALYRSILVTLPTFESRKYVLVEVTTLISMHLLHSCFYYLHPVVTIHHPPHSFFGMADTLNIATMSGVFGFFDVIKVDGSLFFEKHGNSRRHHYSTRRHFDLLCVMIHVFVVGFSVLNIVRNRQTTYSM